MSALGPDVELVLTAKRAPLAEGVEVLRALPQAQRRMVGPFIFLDQMGPMKAGAMTVLPHPHIGLSTVTYLFEGAVLHKDTLGSVQRIEPGAVNWMTAGRGIAHSERAQPGGERLYGIQIWVALPKALEECEPTFVHHPRASLPVLDDGGTRVTVVAGEAYGATSPVQTASELFYCEVLLEPGAVLEVPGKPTERAVQVVEGSLELGQGVLAAHELAVLQPTSTVLIRAREPSRVLLFGGEPLEGPRHIHWNFVSSSKERIEQAKADWRAQRFGTIEGETEFVPLPSR